MALTIKNTCLLLLTVCLFSAPCLSASPTIYVAADPWCPYNCLPESKKPGVMIELAREALALSGYTLHYRLLNWARAKIMVQSGELDGIVGMAHTEKSKDLYYFPNMPLGESKICLFKRREDNWHYQGVESLESKVFGWINDYGFLPDKLDGWVKQHKNTPQILTVAGKDTHARLFKLLQLKRIDTFGEDRSVIAYELRQAGLDSEIDLAGCLVNAEDIYIAFSLKAAQKEKWAEALDSGMNVLKQNGRYLQILEKYGLDLQDWVSRASRH